MASLPDGSFGREYLRFLEDNVSVWKTASYLFHISQHWFHQDRHIYIISFYVSLSSSLMHSLSLSVSMWPLTRGQMWSLWTTRSSPTSCRDTERSMICCTRCWACPPTCWVSRGHLSRSQSTKWNRVNCRSLIVKRFVIVQWIVNNVGKD